MISSDGMLIKIEHEIAATDHAEGDIFENE